MYLSKNKINLYLPGMTFYVAGESISEEVRERSTWNMEHGTWKLTIILLFFLQRSFSSSSTSESPTKLNIAAVASTAVAIGSVAWYYHLYGSEAHAMTPAEEG